jgi:hypothetical protein
MVGARGFEPPASWSRTRMTRKMNNLALGIDIEMGFDRVFQVKRLHLITPFHVATGNSPSMQGVGIVLGIVDLWRQSFRRLAQLCSCPGLQCQRHLRLDRAHGSGALLAPTAVVESARCHRCLTSSPRTTTGSEHASRETRVGQFCDRLTPPKFSSVVKSSSRP